MRFDGALKDLAYHAAHDLLSRRRAVSFGSYAGMEEYLPFTTPMQLGQALLQPDFIDTICEHALGADYDAGKVAHFAQDEDFQKAFRLLFEHQYFDATGRVVRRESHKIPALYHDIKVMFAFKSWLDSLPTDSPLYVAPNLPAYKALVITALLHDVYEDSNEVRRAGTRKKDIRAAQERLKGGVLKLFGGNALGHFIADGIDVFTNAPQDNHAEMVASEKTDKFVKLVNRAVAEMHRFGKGMHFENFMPQMVMIKVFDSGNNTQSDVDGYFARKLFKLDRLEKKAARMRMRYRHLGRLGKMFDPAVRKGIRALSRDLNRTLPLRKRWFSAKMRLQRRFKKSTLMSFSLFTLG